MQTLRADRLRLLIAWAVLGLGAFAPGLASAASGTEIVCRFITDTPPKTGLKTPGAKEKAEAEVKATVAANNLKRLESIAIERLAAVTEATDAIATAADKPKATEIATKAQEAANAAKLVVAFSRNSAVAAAANLAKINMPSVCTRPANEPKTLAGPGGVAVVIEEAQFHDAMLASSRIPLRLFLNGIDLGPQGAPASIQREGNFVVLHYLVGSRKEGAEKFWSSVYAAKGLSEEVPLRLSLGWDTEPSLWDNAVNDSEGHALSVRISNWYYMWAALAAMVVLLISFWWALKKTDMFRTAPWPQWFLPANQIKAAFTPFNAVFASIPIPTQSLTDAQTEIRKVAGFESFSWPAVTATSNQDINVVIVEYYQACIVKGRNALTGQLFEGDDLRDAILGIGFRWPNWKLEKRRPYSLARVQSGIWFVFAVTAAIFLWVAYGGVFPKLDGSVLGLLAISVATTGGSLLVDKTKAVSLYPSNNFVMDLLTDADDLQQAHRYQALVVNVLLLGVGLAHVVQNLTYPTFDPTWLGLLGVSGVAQTLGKQAVEREKTEPPPQKVDPVTGQPL